MSLKTTTRRLVQPAAALKSSSSWPLVPRRTLFGGFFGRRPPSNPNVPSNPILDAYLKQKPTKTEAQLTRGDLTSSSIFEADRVEQAEKAKDEPQRSVPARDPAAMSAALDPDPRARKRWERKMVIRQVRRGGREGAVGRLTRIQRIKRTERESLSKSHFIKTSVKKLGPLARQIAGKPIEEAIVQMRFSKKRAAQEVRAHLEHARNEAVVRRGMGLGKVEGRAGEPVEIETKEGKKHRVEDKTGIYVDQAWVGRGTYGVGMDHRARGQIHRLRPPYTSISVLLKEEATRIRESEERQKKRANRKLWVQLPNRPITGQSQYYSW